MRGVVMINYKIIGERIKKHRLIKNLSQEKISEKLNVSVTYISRIERGNTKPNLEMLDNISEVLEISLSEIITGISSNDKMYLNDDFFIKIETLNSKKIKLLYEFISILEKSDM